MNQTAKLLSPDQHGSCFLSHPTCCHCLFKDLIHYPENKLSDWTVLPVWTISPGQMNSPRTTEAQKAHGLTLDCFFALLCNFRKLFCQELGFRKCTVSIFILIRDRTWCIQFHFVLGVYFRHTTTRDEVMWHNPGTAGLHLGLPMTPWKVSPIPSAVFLDVSSVGMVGAFLDLPPFWHKRWLARVELVVPRVCQPRCSKNLNHYDCEIKKKRHGIREYCLDMVEALTGYTIKVLGLIPTTGDSWSLQIFSSGLIYPCMSLNARQFPNLQPYHHGGGVSWMGLHYQYYYSYRT